MDRAASARPSAITSSLAHRALDLNPIVRGILIFFAMLNGSGAPTTWAASHRVHHANADTPDDVSSPVMHGFWWAHLRWLWQLEAPDVARYCPDLNSSTYRIWRPLQPAILALSFFGGLYFGLAAFFWLGAIRLVFSLHAQCFVNSVCHSEPIALRSVKIRVATCDGSARCSSFRAKTGIATITHALPSHAWAEPGTSSTSATSRSALSR